LFDSNNQQTLELGQEGFIDHKCVYPLRSTSFFCMENYKDGDDTWGYIRHIDFSENLCTEIFTKQNKYEIWITSKYVSIPVAAQSKACVCGPSLAGILGSNPGECVNFCL